MKGGTTEKIEEKEMREEIEGIEMREDPREIEMTVTVMKEERDKEEGREMMIEIIVQEDMVMTEMRGESTNRTTKLRGTREETTRPEEVVQAIGTVVISQNTVRNVTRQNETPVTIVTPEIIVIPVTRVTVRERNVDSAVPPARTDTTARMRDRKSVV